MDITSFREIFLQVSLDIVREDILRAWNMFQTRHPDNIFRRRLSDIFGVIAFVISWVEDNGKSRTISFFSSNFSSLSFEL